MLERRANPIGRAATADVPRITLGGLRIAVLDLEQTADFMVNLVFPQRRLARPLYLTSANGEVLARCSTEPQPAKGFPLLRCPCGAILRRCPICGRCFSYGGCC